MVLQRRGGLLCHLADALHISQHLIRHFLFELVQHTGVVGLKNDFSAHIGNALLQVKQVFFELRLADVFQGAAVIAAYGYNYQVRLICV